VTKSIHQRIIDLGFLDVNQVIYSTLGTSKIKPRVLSVTGNLDRRNRFYTVEVFNGKRLYRGGSLAEACRVMEGGKA
jgi:hypothetical protein